MNLKERISTNETQEEIKIPEVKAETPVTIEQIKAQISELQAKLEEIKKTNQDTAQAETARIDDAVKKLGVGNPEETIAAKTEVENVEAEKQKVVSEAEEKIVSAVSEEGVFTSEQQAENNTTKFNTKAWTKVREEQEVYATQNPELMKIAEEREAVNGAREEARTRVQAIDESLLFEESTPEDEEPPLHEEPLLEELTPRNEDKELIEFLKSKVGQGYIERIYELKSIESENEREPNKEQPLPTIEHTELLGIKKEIVELVLKTLPKHFFANIKLIQYYNIKHKTQKIHGSKDAVATANQRTQEIKFYENAKNREKKWVLERALFHEIGHLNDWMTNKFLTLTERLTLCKTIIGRVESPQRFKFHRVEKIKNDDKKYELATKALEYYGDIVSQYFINPDDLPEEDKIIVEEIIKKNDPEYNERNGRMERSFIF